MPLGRNAGPAGLCYIMCLRKVPMAEGDTNSIFDLPPDAEAEARLDAEAEADRAAGRVVPHERVREWLAKLARGEKVPPPDA